MRELSLHILDIAENGLRAGATLLEMNIDACRKEGRLLITVRDNGSGMPAGKQENPSDPFITTQTARKVGLGLSLLAAAAERCNGHLEIDAGPGKGTTVTARFQYSHIDRAPVGDMAATLAALIVGHPGVDFVFTHRIDTGVFSFDTREIKADMPELPLTDPAVIHQLADSIRTHLTDLAAKTRQAR
jgi:hypothetical protein